MRTTIELPDSLKQKLIAEAASRNMKGYSKLIAEALQEYFKMNQTKREQTINSLRGCLCKEEYKKEIKRLEEGRANWRD